MTRQISLTITISEDDDATTFKVTAESDLIPEPHLRQFSWARVLREEIEGSLANAVNAAIARVHVSGPVKVTIQ